MNKIIENDLKKILTYIKLNKLKNKTILLTGSNGLIGSFLVQLVFYLNKIGYNIKLLGYSKNSAKYYLKYVLSDNSDNNIKLFASDLVYEKFKNLPKIDYIIHAATYAQPRKFLEDKLTTIALNTLVLKKLLDIAKINSSSVLFLSSSEIYGQPPSNDINPISESYNGSCSTISTRAPYIESKRLGETICDIYRKEEKVDVKIVRVSSIYGPGIDIRDKRVLGEFINKALNKKVIDLLDEGKQIRTWCYISDTIIMLLYILLYGKDFIYNVAGKSDISILGLAQLIGKYTNVPVKIPKKKKELDYIKDAPIHIQIDISKIVNESMYYNFVPIEEGIKRFVEWNEAVLNLKN